MSRNASSASRFLLAAAPALLGLALSASAGHADPAGPGAKLLHTAKAVPGEYIVVMKAQPSAHLAAAEVSTFNSSFDALAAKHSATITSRYTAALVGFAAKMSEADALALSEDPAVAFVEENTVVHASAVTQAAPTWGLDRVDQTALPLDMKFVQLDQGEGATIYVIDTGIRTTHAEFTGRLLPGFTSFADGMGTTDCQGHGSHVAGTAAGTTYGIAKKAKLVPVRTLDCTGSGTSQTSIDGINFMISKATPRAVANMSLGGPASAALDAAVTNAINAGYTMVVAAGNENQDACLVSPARAALAITVGATAINDSRSTFSNWGSCVDLSAPGTNITSAAITGDTAVRTISGTSMATPHVAGAAAAYLSANPTATPAQVTAALIGKAYLDKITDPKGSPNRLLNTRFVDTVAPVVTFDAPAVGKEVEKSFSVTLTVTELNLESVSLSLDGTELGVKAEGPFVFDVKDQKPGVHMLTVVAKDLAGQTTTSQLEVTVAEEGGCSVGGGGGTAMLLMLVALVAFGRRRR